MSVSFRHAGSFRARATALATIMASACALGLPGSTGQAEAASAPRSYLVNARTPGQTKAAQAAAVKAGGQVVQSWPQIGVIVVRSTRPGYLNRLKAQRSRAVLSAGDARGISATERVTVGKPVTVSAPGRRVTATATRVGKTDPMARQQSHLTVDRATKAHAVTPGSSHVVVGVIDTGVDDRHPDLARNFSRADSVDCTNFGRPNTAAGAWRGKDSHGTHVAGTIAAARNGYGVTGVAPGVRVASLKVVNSIGESYPEYTVCAYMWAGARQLAVTNASLNMFDLWCGDLQIASPAMTSVRRAIDYAAGRRVVNVSSTGNSGADISWQRGESCQDPISVSRNVVHVTSVNAKGGLSEFASHGRSMTDIAAPGEQILSDAVGRRFERRSGTSQAAPQVAGTLALMKSRRPAASNATLVKTLKRTTKAVPVRTIGRECRGTVRSNSCTGFGQLDSFAAVKAI